MKKLSELNNTASGQTSTEPNVATSEEKDVNVSSGTSAVGSSSSSANDRVPEESQDKVVRSNSDAELTVPKANGHGPMGEVDCSQVVTEKEVAISTPNNEENSKCSPLIGKMEAIGESVEGKLQENPQKTVDAVSSSD